MTVEVYRKSNDRPVELICTYYNVPKIANFAENGKHYFRFIINSGYSITFNKSDYLYNIKNDEK